MGILTSKQMHMYCWIRQPSFIAIAQAGSVSEARKLALDQIGHGDGSCPERDKAAEYIRENSPSIWYGPSAEFVLTDSAELIEQENYCEMLSKRLTIANDVISRIRRHVCGIMCGGLSDHDKHSGLCMAITKHATILPA